MPATPTSSASSSTVQPGSSTASTTSPRATRIGGRSTTRSSRRSPGPHRPEGRRLLGAERLGGAGSAGEEGGDGRDDYDRREGANGREQQTEDGRGRRHHHRQARGE